MHGRGFDKPQNARLLIFRRFRPAHRPLLVELVPQHLDDDRRNADVHHVGIFSDADLHADGDNSLVRRQDLHQLRIGLVTLNAELHRRHAVPGELQVVDNDPEKPFHDGLLDLGYFTVDFGRIFSRPSEEHFENRKYERGIDLENGVPLAGPHAQRHQAGRRGQAL